MRDSFDEWRIAAPVGVQPASASVEQLLQHVAAARDLLLDLEERQQLLREELWHCSAFLKELSAGDARVTP